MEILDILTLARDDHRQVQFCDSIHAECDMNDVIKLSKKISSGQFLSVASDFDNTSLSVQSLLSACADDSRPVYETVHSLALSHINNESNKAKVLKLAEVQLLGVAYLELYCQINYTGPELPPDVLEIFKHEGTVQNCVKELECDGTYAFRSIEIPQTLLLARILLSVVADPSDASWRHGIALDAEGAISRKKINGDESTCHFKEERLKLRSAHWWSVRATVIHLRLLQKQSYEDVPTLWQEVCDRFQYVLEGFSSMAPDSDLLSTASFSSIDPEQVRALAVAESHLSLPTVGATEEVVDAWPLLQRQLATQAWLEWGLCCLHFGYGDKGKKCFAVAQETAGLQTYMTASMGKRTKHQHSEYAQLFLYAKSSLMASGCDSTAVAAPSAPVVDELPPPPTVQVTPVTAEAEGGDTKGEGWEHSEWEMGRRLVREGADGEEIAVREVMLDSMDGGAAQNIVLEGGPKFSSAGLDKGGALHPVDQAIILALCLDVSNSNPVDGLTNEEMQPYVERVLELASNWMIHSTGLLERSWLEFERRKTMDRAMLQIQALIDQHTTKLTITQSTFKSIEESAPAQDRLRYLYSIVYPAQYELKRDLAIRYLRCQVFMSALNYFRELEMWDEVVTCYQLMDKPHRAELVVREQLAKSGETPYMLTSLADLTRKEEYYNRAWELSKGRFPRAKRTLGKICYDRGDFAECIENLDAALSVHPLVATAWYLKGLACMRLERWDEAVQSFVRCVQQDMEIGEAWANIGAVNMRLRSWPKAYEALNEALKHKHDNWRILENLMTVALAMGKWRDVIRFMQRLLDLRLKSERPLHKDELRHLCYIVSSQGQREAKLRAKAAAAAATADPATVTSPSVPETPEDPAAKAAIAAALISLREVLEDDPEFDADDIDTILEVQPLPDLVVATDKLLTNITGAVPSDAEVWDVFAEFQHTLGRFREELDCRTKQFRRLSSEAAWEKHPEKIAAIAAAAKLLARAHHFKGVKKTDFYTCKMILQTVQRRLDSNTFESPEEKAVIDRLITKFSNIYDSM